MHIFLCYYQHYYKHPSIHYSTFYKPFFLLYHIYTKELHLSVDEKAIKIRLPEGVLPKVREIKERLDEGVEKIEEKIATAVGAKKAKA